MVLVTSNAPKQLIHLSFIGHVTAQQFIEAEKDVRALLAALPPGSRLLTDLERLELMDLQCAPEIGRMMDIFKTSGIALAVRIIPDPKKDIGLSILSVFHYGRKIRTVTCKDMAEALRALKL
jgi:hypothetical protein